MNNQAIFPTAEEMTRLTVSSGLERLMDEMKANAKNGRKSVKTHNKEEIKLIVQREGLIESLGYGVLKYRDWHNNRDVAEIIWGY